MKHLFLKTALLCLAVFGSCSKSDDSPELTPETHLRVKQITTSGGSIIQYTYDNQGKLTKEASAKEGNTLYTYNSQGKLTKIERGGTGSEYEYYTDSYFYDTNGSCNEQIVEYKLNRASAIPRKYKYNHFYDSTNLTRIIKTISRDWDFSTNTWHTIPGSISVYQYNLNGNVMVVENGLNNNSYTNYTYDNNNIQRYETYNLKTGSSTQFYKESEGTYTYDNKKRPYTNRPDPTGTIVFSKTNNLLDITSKRFDETGATTSAGNLTYIYEYNAEGYPVTIKTGNSISEFIYEKY